MKDGPIISKLRPGIGVAEAGNKALSLLKLQEYRFRIPSTCLITSAQLPRLLNDRKNFLDRLYAELEALPAGQYAVRSSGALEDSADYSYAGQYQTILNVSGAKGLQDAIVAVWENSQCLAESEYNKRALGRKGACAVIIQEMVPAILAGVCFSRNPITGQNETIIEAVEGPGEDLVQKGLAPLRWKFRKELITDGDSSFSHIDVIRELARSAGRLRKKAGTHIDMEWAFDGKDIFYLQFRPITALKEIGIYSNKMAKEMLPGQIKPLVWSVNIPVVNGTWIGILSEITGPLAVKPEDLARQFYFRTYFNVAALTKIFGEFGMSSESLENLLLSKDDTRHSFKPGLRTLKHTFRLLKFVTGKMRFEKFFQKEYKVLKERYSELGSMIEPGFPPEKYTELRDKLFSEGRRLTYINIFAPMFMQLYNKKLAKRLIKKGIEYDSLDFNADFPVLDTLSPLAPMKRINEMLRTTEQEKDLIIESFSDLDNPAVPSGLKEEINCFIKTFGHFSESGNDFSMIKWQEDPDMVLRMIRSSAAAKSSERLVSFSELKKNKRLKLSSLEGLYRKAGRFKVYREQVSSLFIYGHGLFRYLYLKMGRELVRRGLLSSEHDVFYLYREEIERFIADGLDDSQEAKKIAEKRKDEIEITKDYLLPSVIYGETAPILETGRKKNHYGTGTSSGSFTGTTRVVRGSDDFAEVRKGDVLLIPFSDVSWTPVLAKAGAIVSETGGMLSHSSIIAREMGIPALASIENCCALGTGLKATVDGSNGIFTIHDYE